MSNEQPPSQPPLGQTSFYPAAYDPGLLFAMPRTEQRNTLGKPAWQAAGGNSNGAGPG